MRIWQFPHSKHFIDLEAVQTVSQPSMLSDTTYGFVIILALQTVPFKVVINLDSEDEDLIQAQKKTIESELVALLSAWQGIVDPEIVVPLSSLESCQLFKESVHLVLKADSSSSILEILSSMNYPVLTPQTDVIVPRKLLLDITKAQLDASLPESEALSELRMLLG